MTRPGSWDPLLALCFAAAVLAGRMTTVSGGPSMLWPAAGVSMVWFYPHARRGWRSPWTALLLLNLTTVAVNLATDAPLGSVGAYCVANTLMAVVSADVLRRGRNRDWAERVDSPGRLYQLFAASLIGALVSGIVGSALLALAGTWMSPVGWAMRNTAGALMVGLFWYRLARHGVRVLDKPTPLVRGLLVLGTAVSYAAVIFMSDGLPLFLLVPVSMLTALWTDVRTTAWHTVTVASGVVAITMLGRGTLAAHPPDTRALLVQTFAVVLAMVAMTIVLDREDRRRLEDTLEANRLATEQHAALLDRIVHSLSEGVVLVDSMGHVGLGNPELRRILGTGRDQCGAATLPPEVFDPTFATAAPVNEVLRTGEPATADVAFTRADGSARIVAVTAAPLISAEGTQAVAILRDVTDERRHTQELANFAGVVAHDLRNPLAALCGWLDLLGDELATPPSGHAGHAPEMVGRMVSAAGRMKALIEDLLSYSVVRGGELRPRVHHLEEICADVLDGCREQASVGAEPRIEASIDAFVRVDPIALKQLLANLVGNACKYAVPGRAPQIELSLGPVQDGMRRVRVADRGIGLPPGQEEAVFEEFHRVGDHATQYVGTGLGLAICRRVVERHGGRIHAANRPGGGLIVEFTVPHAEPSPADRLALAAWRQSRAARHSTTTLATPAAAESNPALPDPALPDPAAPGPAAPAPVEQAEAPF